MGGMEIEISDLNIGDNGPDHYWDWRAEEDD